MCSICNEILFCHKKENKYWFMLLTLMNLENYRWFKYLDIKALCTVLYDFILWNNTKYGTNLQRPKEMQMSDCLRLRVDGRGEDENVYL